MVDTRIPEAERVADYHILCARREECPMDAKRQHVTVVATGTWPTFTKTWDIVEVCRAIVAGDRFFIKLLATVDVAEVRCVLCPGCGHVTTLESTTEAVKVDQLPILR
jgi:hypothetical protein